MSNDYTQYDDIPVLGQEADEDYEKFDDIPDLTSDVVTEDEEPEREIPLRERLQSALQTAQDFGGGVLSGATAGFDDEIMARLGSMTDGTDYDQNLEILRQMNKEEAERSPIAREVGDLTGSLAQMAIPGMQGMGVGKGLVKAGTSLAQGVGLAGLEAAGRSEASIGSDEFMGDVATGAAFGAGTQLGAKGLGVVAKRLKGSITPMMAKKAEAAGGIDRTQGLRTKLEERIQSGRLKEGELGEFLLQEDIVRAGKSAKNMLGDVVKKKKVTGERIGKILEEGMKKKNITKRLTGKDAVDYVERLKAGGPKSQAELKRFLSTGTVTEAVDDKINTLELAAKLREKARTHYADVSPTIEKDMLRTAKRLERIGKPGKPELSKILDERGNPMVVKEGLPAKAEYSAAELNKQKSIIGAQVGDAFEKVENKESKKELYGILSDTVKESLDPKQRAKLEAANRRFEKLNLVEEGITGQSAMEEGKDLVPWADLVVAGTAGPKVAIARNLYNRFGGSFIAAGIRPTSGVLKNEKWVKTFDEFTKRDGPAGVAAAHFLLQQTDPTYRKKTQKED